MSVRTCVRAPHVRVRRVLGGDGGRRKLVHFLAIITGTNGKVQCIAMVLFQQACARHLFQPTLGFVSNI